MTNLLFNRKLHQMRRDKAAANFSSVDFLLQEAADRLADRLLDIDRSFNTVLDLGGYSGQLASALHQTKKIKHLISTDYSVHMAARNHHSPKLVCDDELLPFASNQFDAICSAMSLQWVNDLPGCLIQCRHALKEDGLFLTVMPGPRTLEQLRESLLTVSLQSGLAPRISPFAEVRDAGSLLQRAGFALPVVDSEILTIRYREPMTLLNEIRAMGQANALTQQHKGMTAKSFWPRVMQHYSEHYALEDGRLPMTVELVFMTGWKPHNSQQQPAKRGSGQVNLGKVFN